MDQNKNEISNASLVSTADGFAQLRKEKWHQAKEGVDTNHNLPDVPTLQMCVADVFDAIASLHISFLCWFKDDQTKMIFSKSGKSP